MNPAPLWRPEESDALDRAIREGRKREAVERNPRPVGQPRVKAAKATQPRRPKPPKPLPRMRKQRDFWVVIYGTPGYESKRRFSDPNKATKFLNQQRKTNG